MSHDFAFWHSEEPLENEEAGEIYVALCESGACSKVKPSSKIAILAKEIRKHWPVPRRGHEDDWPLAAPPDVAETHVVTFLVPSRLWDVWPILGELAEKLELVIYDPQQQHVFLPRRLSRKRTRLRAKKKRSTGT